VTLRRRILWGSLAVAAITLLAGLLGAASIRRESRQAAQEELFRQAEVTARLVEQQLEGATRQLVDRPAVARAQRVLEEVRVIGGHDFLEAAIVAPRGRIIELVDDPSLLPLIAVGVVDREVRNVTVDGESVFATVRSIEIPTTGDEGTFRMMVAIGRFDTFLIGAVITRTLLFALVAGGAVAAALAIALSRDLGRRLERLSLTARAYAGGDFTARAPESGHDELAEVGHAFNDMAAEMADLRRRERDFLMSVGHDLRTPLTTIRGYAEGLDSGTLDAADLPRVAGVLHTQTDRLGRLVEDVMLLARLESREFDLRPESVDLAAHLSEVVDGYAARADLSHVRVIPDIGDVGMVYVDPDRFSQVAGNLLDNALGYTPEEGIVQVRLRRRAEQVRLEVQDSGPGIDSEDLPHVFERLYVAQRYRPIRPEGSGLGLAIVKELTDAMNGEVHVASSPGKGTTVTVTLSV
jgi:two-component system sensor histidine kinase BaeS